MLMAIEKKKIVVVGGGFAGLNFIKPLRNNPAFEITLIDINNYHFFPPLLYQVAMALIEPTNIAYPFRRFFQKRKGLRFHMGKLLNVNVSTNSVETESGTLYYDFLVLAVGTEPKHFGMENVKRCSLPLKTIDDATNMRNHLLLNVERAVQSKNEYEKQRLLTVVIAGGGPTGVEVAGMMAEMVNKIGPKEYPEITPGTFKIYLVQGSSELLKSMSKKAQREAFDVLTKLRIKVLLNTRVVDYLDGKVILNEGEPIPTNALIWTSGVIGSEINGFSKNTFGAGRRLLVNEQLVVKGTSNVFAIGDIGLHTSQKEYPEGHPQLAQVAIQQGKYLAKNLVNSFHPGDWKPFRYKEKGTMAIISKYKAVADLPTFSFKGFGAWLAWLFIHLIPIAGFKNKFDLASSWAWAFITNNPTLRLIIRPEKKVRSQKHAQADEAKQNAFEKREVLNV
jgi:NADH:ubiquinone reductase (H+-translocating)